MNIIVFTSAEGRNKGLGIAFHPNAIAAIAPRTVLQGAEDNSSIPLKFIPAGTTVTLVNGSTADIEEEYEVALKKWDGEVCTPDYVQDNIYRALQQLVNR